MVYDAESGLMYTETVVSVNKCKCLSIDCDESGGEIRYIAPSRARGERRGARSLQDMVTERILANRKQLEFGNAVQTGRVPASLVQMLWRVMKDRRADSLRVWQVFATTNIEALDRVRKWHWKCQSKQCAARLPQLLTLANSPSVDWLTDLTLTRFNLTFHDFLGVSKLHNLRDIHVQGNACRNMGLTDRVVRAWSRAAQEQKAFSKLVMLSATASQRGGKTNITHWSLNYLSSFPALEVFCLRGFRLESKYTAVGRQTGSGFVVCKSSSQPLLNSRANDVCTHLPVLEVTVGPSATNTTGTTSGVVCFERDWTSRWVPPSEENALLPPPLKKRKIKEGKVQTMANMMDGML